jgi:hypothetical protein
MHRLKTKYLQNKKASWNQIFSESLYQCCGSMTFWIRIWIRGSMPLTNGSGCGSGSSYFRHSPSFTNKKLIFVKVLLLITFWRYMFIIFKDKKSKRSHKPVGIKVSYFFGLVIEGSRSGSIPLTDGSGSRRPKNMWIRWIRIRIRIRNTAFIYC